MYVDHHAGPSYLRQQAYPSNHNNNSSNHESSSRLPPPFSRNTLDYTPFDYHPLDPSHNDMMFYDGYGQPSPLAPVSSVNQPLKPQQPFFLGTSPELNQAHLLANSAQAYDPSIFGGDFLHAAPNDLVAASSEWNPLAVVDSTGNPILPVRATSPMP